MLPGEQLAAALNSMSASQRNLIQERMRQEIMRAAYGGSYYDYMTASGMAALTQPYASGMGQVTTNPEPKKQNKLLLLCN